MAARRTRDQTASAPRGREARSAQKRAAIIESATACFLSAGYPGTSVDNIAARAGVAKQTVYEHFGDKERLFNEIVLRTIDEVGQPFFDRIAELEQCKDPDALLTALAHELVTVVKQPRLLDLRRLVIAEVARFPRLARLYHERGPGRTVDALASTFERLDREGQLQVEDPRFAAQQFNWLVLSIPINRAMFSPRVRFRQAELDRWAREAVRVFLLAYGRAQSP